MFITTDHGKHSLRDFRTVVHVLHLDGHITAASTVRMHQSECADDEFLEILLFAVSEMYQRNGVSRVMHNLLLDRVSKLDIADSRLIGPCFLCVKIENE